jgi:hypothetical protein
VYFSSLAETCYRRFGTAYLFNLRGLGSPNGVLLGGGMPQSRY